VIGGDIAVVTGATGFLGSHLVRRLLSEGCAVHTLTRPNSTSRRLRDVEQQVIQWQGDVTDLKSLLTCCRQVRPNAIYHLAGDTAGRTFSGDWDVVEHAVRTNMQGTLNLFRAAVEAGPQLRCVVRTGGLEEYGAGSTPFSETQRELPRSPYSMSQVASTHLGQMLQPHLPFALLTLRPTLIYGPDQSTAFLIPGLIQALLQRKPFRLTEGRQRRDYLHVADFVDAAMAVFGRDDLRGAIINIASGQAHAIRDVATSIARMLGAEDLLEIGGAPSRTAEITDLVGDASLAERLLGWKPRVGLTEGLSGTIDWYRRDIAEASL
jgi:UDP-glucose 4-epimerase